MAKFQRGNPGGPGRPRGSSSTWTAYKEQADAQGKELVAVVMKAALEGDLSACRLLMDRIWPVSAPELQEMQSQIEELREQLAAISGVRAA